MHTEIFVQKEVLCLGGLAQARIITTVLGWVSGYVTM